MRNIAFVLVSLLIAAPAWSQTITIPAEEIQKPVEPPPQPAPIPEQKKEDAKVERVEVTGSHIKRIDVEGAGPIQVITKRDMDKTGYNSVSDVLRDTAANSFGGTRETSGSAGAGVAHADLRGLGSDKTLVLLNGERLPTEALDGSVDLNMIPMAAVERIEVLKDGASAVYGSDALGGVINIITRKDFTGSEISLSQTTPERVGGKRDEISLVNGFNIGRANTVTTLMYRDNEKIYSRDRAWTTNRYSPYGSPGSYRDQTGANNTWKADPNCPPGMISHQLGGTVCLFKFSDYSTELPAIQQLSLMNETTIPIGSRVTLHTRLGGSQRKTQWSYAPSPDIITVPASQADGIGLPGHTPGTDVDVRYRVTDLGTRDSDNVAIGYNALVGATVDVGSGWEVEATASHNRVIADDKGVNGYALTSTMEDLIGSGGFNPLRPPGQRGDLGSARYIPIEHTSTLISTVDLKGSGPVAELPSGSLSVAVGTTFTYQKYQDQFDDHSVNDDVFGNAGSSGGGQRDTRAVYSEIDAPITKKLELQLAARYDEYSDFGNTTNPKMGLVYKPTRQILLRGSVGTGFKAPNMQDLYAATGNGAPTFIDHVACDHERHAGGATPSCSPSQYTVTSGGNTGLKEERSISYNGGVIYQPTRDFNIGTDFFLTKLNNVVGIDLEDMTRAEASGVDPSAYGVIVHRTNGVIDDIIAPQQNLSTRQISGLDLQAEYRFWKMRVGTDHSQLFYYKEEGFPGAGQRNKLGENGRPAWRNVTTVAFNPNERHDISLSGVTTAGQEKAVVEMGHLRSYTTYDLQYSYRMKRFGTLMAGVKNLLDTVPPIDDSNSTLPLNTDLYDQIGRQYYTGYKATF